LLGGSSIMKREPQLIVKTRPIQRLRRRRPRPGNPLADPMACIKRPLRSLNGPAPGYPILEFESIDVRDIRRQFHATQRVFAEMLGIKVETLRNWEQGRRSPHGPARSLLRMAASSPEEVARVLLRGRRRFWD
jgi:putative transcriptional regulator